MIVGSVGSWDPRCMRKMIISIFRFEPSKFPIAGWMLVGLDHFFGLKKNFPVSN